MKIGDIVRFDLKFIEEHKKRYNGFWRNLRIEMFTNKDLKIVNIESAAIFPEALIIEFECNGIKSEVGVRGSNYLFGVSILDSRSLVYNCPVFVLDSTIKNTKTDQTDLCKKCGSEGNRMPMSCICTKCGEIIWGI